MAQKAKKDRAKSNASALTSLHIGSLIVNAIFLISHFLYKPRSLVLYGVLSAPAIICQYVLERAGRPRFDAETGALKSSGEDLSAPGLTEYMFDVVWVTWASVILVTLFGNGGWLLWVVVPAYGLYQGAGLLGAGKQMAQMQAATNDAAPPAGGRRQRRAA
jgi:hypothetical protein